MKTLYTLLSGETVEFTAPTGELGTFLRRVIAAVADPGVSAGELEVLVHGPENPLLDKTLVRGKAVATADVYRHPVFHVMLDCLARKRISPPSTPRPEAPARYKMTVPQAAKQLRISEGGVRQAIRAHRLAAKKTGTTYTLDPKAVAKYMGDRRGRERREDLAKRPRGAPLEARVGYAPDASFRVKHSQEEEMDIVEKRGREWTVTIPAGWRRIGILGISKQRTQFWEIEPAEGEDVLDFEGFYVRGGIRIVDTVTTARKARAVFGKFEPS